MKKWISGMLSLTLLTGMLAACSSGEEDSASGGDKKEDNTITIWSFTDELERQGAIEAFEEKYDAKVDFQIIPTEDYTTKAKPALESGVGAP
ncbi:hypothetical protein [Bacillus carboniphilus]|uniref:hypothetical protein n=1 Tax=Bacillus carboniphilus TaxID=86663 RepID=UPI003531E38C